MIYLSYGMFDQRLSTKVMPKIPVGSAPTAVAQSTLKDAGVVRQLALMLLTFQASDGPDIGRVVAETTRFTQRQRETRAFAFLEYASRHWMLHKPTIHEKSSTFTLWLGLLKQPRFDGLV